MAEELRDRSNPAVADPRPHLVTAVVMRREPVPGPMARWQPWRWVLADVVVVQRPDGSRLPYWPVAAGAPVALQADELGHTEGDLAPVSCSS